MFIDYSIKTIPASRSSITAAPTLDGDVYTIGVTPIQHEVKQLASPRQSLRTRWADPTEFVRKTGDTMTGSLMIDVPAGNATYIKSGNTTGVLFSTSAMEIIQQYSV